MKRTKQMQNLVDEVNLYLKKNHIKETSDPVFNMVTMNLIHQKIYNGFNYYTADGKLSGGVNTDYIQIW